MKKLIILMFVSLTVCPLMLSAQDLTNNEIQDISKERGEEYKKHLAHKREMALLRAKLERARFVKDKKKEGRDD